MQSWKQSSRLSPPQQQQPPAAEDEEPAERRVALRLGGGLAAGFLPISHLLSALVAEAAASASSPQSHSPFRFRFAPDGGGGGYGPYSGGHGGFRWKRWEVAPTAANNADLRKLLKRSTFDDLDCRGMYDQVRDKDRGPRTSFPCQLLEQLV